MTVALPTYVQMEPVGQCNLRCQMCPIQFREDGPPFGPLAFMEFETYTKLVDQFPAMTALHLQGLGEPMMHPRFFDMVAYAAQKGVKVSTNTNMTLLNRRPGRNWFVWSDRRRRPSTVLPPRPTSEFRRTVLLPLPTGIWSLSRFGSSRGEE